MKDRIRQWLELLSLELVLTIGSLLVAVWLLYLVIPLALQTPLNHFDASVIGYFSAHRSPTLVQWMNYISFLGSSAFLLPAYLVCIGWLTRKKQHRSAIEMAIVGVSSTVVMFSLKQFFERHRPADPVITGVGGFSFPSGHALSGFIFCTLIGEMIYRQPWKRSTKAIFIVILALVSLLIALSRVVLNVHYATDVIGGICLGCIWVIICFSLFRKIRFVKKETP